MVKPGTCTNRKAFFDGGDGWDFLQMLPSAGWQSIKAWGRDGWHLGDWPHVVIAVRRCIHSGQFEVCEYVRGDVTITTWPDMDVAERQIDALAAIWWQRTARGPTRPADGIGPPLVASPRASVR